VDNTRRFIEYGGMVAVGTDTMRMESQPHVATMPLRELQLLHQAGLSVSQVIDAATINAAKLCKIDDQVGSITVGKQANIIAVKASIDETFEALSHVEFVMNRGTVIKHP
jgi:imidazolonepropionase-like amidohydrolase